MKAIAIEIIDDDEFNLDKQFFLRLSNAVSSIAGTKVIIDRPRATVTILDNDHGGIFEFDNSTLEISETKTTAKIRVCVARIPFNSFLHFFKSPHLNNKKAVKTTK